MLQAFTVLKEDLFPTMLKNRLEQGLSASLEQLLATLLDDMNNAKDVSNTIDTINNRKSVDKGWGGRA